MPPVIPGFRLLHSIGSGAYGEVWLGQDVILGVYRAIKIVWLQHDADRTSIEKNSRKHRAERVLRGLQEYLQRVSVLRFPAIAILELKVDPAGRFFHYTMPLADDARTDRELNPLELPIEGYQPLTLSSLCAKQTNGCLPPKTVVRIAARLAEALSELHAANIVHQDIKPANIIFLRGEPIYADVDLIRDLDATRTIAGTAGYAAPEGPGTTAADVYALGKTLYVMATGLSAQNRSLTPAGDWDQLPEAEQLKELVHVWSKACEDNPQYRHTSAAELRNELQFVSTGRGLQQIRRLERFKQRSIKTVLILTPSLIGLGLLLLWSLIQGREQAFALYQAVMARSVTHLVEGRMGMARKSLSEPRALANGRGPEWQALWHQSKGDPARILRSSNQPTKRMAFSPDGARILVEYETNLFVVDSKGIEEPIVVQPFQALGGWLDSEHFVGTQSNRATIPVLIWDLKNLSHPEKVFDGENRMGGPPSKTGTFVFANTAHPDEVALATYPAKSPIQWVRSPIPSPDKWALAPMVDSQLSVLVQMIEYGDGDSFSTHFHFQSLRTNWPQSQRIYPNLNVQSKALSPVGDHFAFSEGQNGRLTVFSGRAFSESTNLSLSIIRALAFSPDGTQLASGGDDEQVRIHSSTTLEVLRTFKGHPSAITSLAWSQDGTRLASGDSSGELRVWDLTQGFKESDLTDGLKAGGLPVRIVVQNSGFLLAISGTNRTVEILDARTLARAQQLSQGHTPIRWEGQELWMLRGAPNALVHHDLTSGITTHFEILNASGDILGEVNSAGKMILFDRDNHVVFTSLPPTGELRFQATHSGKYVDKADISADGNKAATVGDRWLDIWDVQSGTRIHAYHLDKELYSVAFQKGSDFCVLGCDNHELCVINTNTGEQAGKIDTLLDQNFDLILPAGLDRVFSGGSSGKINVAESTSNRSLVVLEHPELRQRKGEHRIRRLAYNPVLNDLYAMTDGGILARWRMAPQSGQH